MDIKPKRKIYLSLPISGYDLQERYDTALAKQTVLEEKGFSVANPLRNGLPATVSTNEHMKRDIEMLLQCDAILFMERWTHSKGCMTEFHVATSIGLDVYFEECFNINTTTKFK